MALKGRNVRVRGRWWHYQFEANGEPHSGTTGLEGTRSNQTAAEEFAARKRAELLHPEPDRRLKAFSEAAGEFSAWARNVEYRSKPNTAKRLKGSMTSCVDFFGNRPVIEIGGAEIEQYKAFRAQINQVRDITLRHDLHALSVFFRYAIKQCWAERNPLAVNPVTGVRDVRIPSDRDAVREHVVSPEEEGNYLRTALVLFSEWRFGGVSGAVREGRKNAHPNMHDLSILMIEQGARPEEILALRKADFNPASRTVWIRGGKTRAAVRLLNLTERSLCVLERRMETEGPWLFPSDRRPGRHITKLQNTHDRICIEAGLSFVIYDFRHTFATRMIDAGVPAPTVAAIMGHSGLRTIYRYIHPTADAKREAMEKYEAAARRRGLKVVGE